MPSITKHCSISDRKWKQNLVGYHAQHYTIMFNLRHVIEAKSCKFSCPASHNSCQPWAYHESSLCEFSCLALHNIVYPWACYGSNFWWVFMPSITKYFSTFCMKWKQIDLLFLLKKYVWSMNVLPCMISMTRLSHVNRRGTPFANFFIKIL